MRQQGRDSAADEADVPDEMPPAGPELSDDEAELLELLESRLFTAVSREEIAEILWPELPVNGVRVGRAMSKAVEGIRAHLGDDSRDPRRLITAGDYGLLLV